jgi:hypothetical protein
MNANAQRRVSVGLLGLAFAAFGVDRFLLDGGGPAEAHAQHEAERLSTEGVPPLPQSLAKPAPKLAERLDELAIRDPGLLTSVPDLFYKPTQHEWEVTSIIGRGRTGAAMINGSMLRVGQVDRASGAELVDVRPGAVVLRLGEKTYTVTPTGLEAPNARRRN